MLRSCKEVVALGVCVCESPHPQFYVAAAADDDDDDDDDDVAADDDDDDNDNDDDDDDDVLGWRPTPRLRARRPTFRRFRSPSLLVEP